MPEPTRDFEYVQACGRGPHIRGRATSPPDAPFSGLVGWTQVEQLICESQKMATVAHIAGGIAHDFNNMLQLVVSSLDVMKGRIDQERMTSELARPLHVASMSADRAAALARRLLTFARSHPRELEPVHVNDVLWRMADLLTWTLGDRIELTMRLDDLPRPILCNAHELENAVLSLVANGRDAMPDGGRVMIETSYADIVTPAATLDPPPHIRIRIADTGTGMAPDQIERAFEPFYTTKPAGRGTGLGLAMVKHFVDRHRGQVYIESMVGRGTVVTLNLPCKHGAFVEG
jgi:signal transduction histidine kinase